MRVFCKISIHFLNTQKLQEKSIDVDFSKLKTIKNDDNYY